MTLLTHPRRALLTGAAAIAFGAGATAGAAHADGFVVNDPALNVPANKIEHVVHEVDIDGVRPQHTLDELWLGSDKAHLVERDVATGKVVGESAWDRGHGVAWDSSSGELHVIDDHSVTPPYQTLSQEAAVWRHTFETGASAQTGETTINGRRSLLLQSVPGKWKTDEPSGVTTMTVDAETFTLYEIKTVLAKEHFSQDVKLKSAETIARTKADESVFDLLPKGQAAKAARRHAKAHKHHRR
ncbi:MAG TPA: hypothetical protein VI318_15095 [Baekduia sp.]